MALDTGDWVKIIAALVGLSYPLLEKLWKSSQRDEEDAPAPPPPRRQPAPAQAKQPRAPAPAPAPPAIASRSPSSAQQTLAAGLERLGHDAAARGESLRQDIANQRFVELLTEWLPREARALRARVLESGPAPRREDLVSANWLDLVYEEVVDLVRQRRDPDLLPLLGDADRLAEKCYAPIIAFAHAEGLPLSTARPVTQLAPIDLSIWTGFAPTKLAPIFLPPSFFESIWYWPAIAHEIGHDFLISIHGLRDKLGDELELPNEAVGTLPLQMQGNQLHASELWRLYGGWLEELFCDVFGTLMCGPAYAATMVELFSYEEDPREVLFVPIDRATGRYDPHPPRHLRVEAVCHVLERAGFGQDAKDIRARWFDRNQLDAEQGVPLLFWVSGSYIYLPYSAFEPLTNKIVDRLYEGPIAALNGFGLTAISGLDYGPHAQAEAARAKATLLAGQVPRIRDVRAVISGAVLAVLEARDRHTQILALARKAIPAVGTNERVPDAYTQKKATVIGGVDISPQALAEALVLREVLARPGSDRSAQRRHR